MTNKNHPRQQSPHPYKSTPKIPVAMRLFFASMRFFFNILDHTSPTMGGKLALCLFMTPPRHPMPKRELATAQSAHKQVKTILGNPLTIYSWGEGPIILLSHGWGGRCTQLYPLVQPLVDAGYRVIGVNLPGHGDSGGKRTSMLEAAYILSEIADDATSTGQPLHAIIGHSFGSGAALLALDRHHLTPEKLVLISSFADLKWVIRMFADPFGLSERLIESMKHIAREKLKSSFGKPWNWEELSPVQTIRNITADTLIIHDRDDHEIPYEQSTQLKKAAPHARLLTTRGLGHRRILRDEHTLQAVMQHISSTPSALY